MKRFKDLNTERQDEVLQDVHQLIGQKIDQEMWIFMADALTSKGYCPTLKTEMGVHVRAKEWSGNTILGVITSDEIARITERMISDPWNIEEKTPLERVRDLNKKYKLIATSQEDGVNFSKGYQSLASYLYQEGEWMLRDEISLKVAEGLIRKELLSLGGFLEELLTEIQNSLWSDESVDKILTKLQFDEDGNLIDRLS